MKATLANKSNHTLTEAKKIDTDLYLNDKNECKSCSKQINSYTFILVGKDFYCVPCFANQKKWAPSYQVINKLSFPVYDQNWAAEEQISLFEGLQKHGFGNWGEITDFIGTAKTKEEVEAHYSKIFLSQPNFLPDNSLIIPQGSVQSKIGRVSKPKIPRNRQSLILKRNSNSAQEAQNSKSAQIEVSGYMPLRADFQFEYDNEAELLLAQMEFTEDDTEEDKKMKFKILDLYNERLTERNKKKEFVMSRGLLNLEKQVTIEKTRGKFQKEIYNMMKIFARFQKTEDHERLVQGIIKQKILKDKIEQYKELRSKGFTTKQDIEHQLEKKFEAKSKKKFNGEYSYRISQNRNRRHNEQVDASILKKSSPYLSPTQITLCKQLKMSGITYMMIKQTILRQHMKYGTVEREQIWQIFSIEKFVINSILNHLVESQGISCRG